MILRINANISLILWHITPQIAKCVVLKYFKLFFLY
jgi:hypothetical protein